MIHKLAAFICAALILPVAASAQQVPVFYECDVSQSKSQLGYISQKLGVIITKDGQTLVTDRLTQNFLGKPQTAKIRSRGSKLIVTWSLEGMQDVSNQQIPKISYRAAIDTKSNKVLVSANPSDSPQRWTGRGTCRQRTR